MMDLVEKINHVKNLFGVLDNRINTFKSKSGIHCKIGCGDCCLKNDIEATILEFLPAAYHLYLSGEYEEILYQVENNPDTICIFFNAHNLHGFCSYYHLRGLICRLFGYSVVINKRLRKSLVTCKHIKNKADLTILDRSIGKAPEMTSYYWQLYGIDPVLGMKQMPINKAILKAIELVEFYFKFKKSAITGS